jgi:hypothetical protein
MRTLNVSVINYLLLVFLSHLHCNTHLLALAAVLFLKIRLGSVRCVVELNEHMECPLSAMAKATDGTPGWLAGWMNRTWVGDTFGSDDTIWIW